MIIQLSDDDNDLVEAVLHSGLREEDGVFSRDQKTRDSAFDALYDLCFGAPNRAVGVIVSVAAKCRDPSVLEQVVSGPLELVFEIHGEQVVNHFLDEANRLESVRDMICSVASSRVSPEVQRRIDDACNAWRQQRLGSGFEITQDQGLEITDKSPRDP